MLKRNNKKGFTLAELLIVVAIIAVLVAIAVPLFIGGVKDAEDARDNANVSNIRSAGIVKILNTKDREDTKFYKDGNLYSYYIVKADVSNNGDISNLAIQGYEKTDFDEQKKTDIEGSTQKEDKTGYTVIAYITALDLT